MQFGTSAPSGEATLPSTVVSTPSARAIATGVAVVAAVALPQAAHVLGAALGLGPAVGKVLLPMFLPVMAVGFLAGPVSGLVAGVLAPLVSSALTGMPVAPLPLVPMVPEVAAFGLACGLLSTRKLPWIVKVLIAEVAGNVAYAVATALIAAAAGTLGADFIGSFLMGVRMGLPGYAIQWITLPLLMAAVTRVESSRDRG